MYVYEQIVYNEPNAPHQVTGQVWQTYRTVRQAPNRPQGLPRMYSCSRSHTIVGFLFDMLEQQQLCSDSAFTGACEGKVKLSEPCHDIELHNTASDPLYNPQTEDLKARALVSAPSVDIEFCKTAPDLHTKSSAEDPTARAHASAPSVDGSWRSRSGCLYSWRRRSASHAAKVSWTCPIAGRLPWLTALSWNQRRPSIEASDALTPGTAAYPAYHHEHLATLNITITIGCLKQTGCMELFVELFEEAPLVLSAKSYQTEPNCKNK